MEALGINVGFLITQIINFTLIFILLRYLLWKPLTGVMEERTAKIEKGLEDARIAAEARDNAEKDAESIRNEARLEAQKIVSDARARAEDAGKDVATEANKEADDIRANARAQAETERDQLLADMRSQVISLAMAAANRLVAVGMDEKKQADIVNDFFAKAPDNVKNLGDAIEVVSALPLTDSEKNEIKKATGAKDIAYKVDPNVLGGLILRAGDQVVDGSFRSSLAAMQAELR